MIQVTRLDDSKMLLNVEMIQSLQASPDTVITLSNKVKMMVKEPVELLSQKIVEYQRSLHQSYLLEPCLFLEPPKTIN